MKAIKARLLSETEARRKEKPQEMQAVTEEICEPEPVTAADDFKIDNRRAEATKKMQAVTEEICEPEPVTAADDFKIDNRTAARDALKRVQQELATKEIEQKLKLELEMKKFMKGLTPSRHQKSMKQKHQAV